MSNTIKQSADYLLSSSAGIEIVVLFALLLVAQHVLPGGDAFAVSPHPYWTVVLLLSVRHGTAAGLAAALVAIALYLLHGVPTRSAEEDYYTYTLRIWREPMLWLVVALIVGEIRLGQIEERNTLAMRLRDAERQRSTIAEHWSLLAGHVEALERSLATQSGGSVETLLTEMEALRSPKPHVAAAAFQRIAQHVLGADARVAFWRHDRARSGAFVLDAGWSCNPDNSRPVWSLPRTLVANDDARRVFCIARDTDRCALQDTGVLACSVISPASNRLYGVLAVQHLDLDRIATTGEAALLFLSLELATALDRHRATDWTADSEFTQRRAS